MWSSMNLCGFKSDGQDCEGWERAILDSVGSCPVSRVRRLSLGTAVRWNQKQFAVVSLFCFIPNLIALCKESDALALDI